MAHRGLLGVGVLKRGPGLPLDTPGAYSVAPHHACARARDAWGNCVKYAAPIALHDGRARIVSNMPTDAP